jgi:hypothetical protein
MGGKKFDGHRTNQIEVFNPITGEVKLLNQTLIKPRSGFASVLVGN